MNKTILIRICNLISVILVACFFVNTLIDYTRYSIADSAPFSLTIILNAIVFLLPAVIVFIVGIVLKKKRISYAHIHN